MLAFEDTNFMTTDENLSEEESTLNFNDTNFDVAFGIVSGNYNDLIA